MWETWVRSLGQADPLGNKMATLYNFLAWKIPWTEEKPGGQQSIGSQRVGHYWPLFLPGEFHGQRSLVGYSSWGSQRVRHDWVTNTFTFIKRHFSSSSLSAIISDLIFYTVHDKFSYQQSPGKNTGGGSCFLLQGIFLTQGLNPSLLHYRQILYHLSHQEGPRNVRKVKVWKC